MNPLAAYRSAARTLARLNARLGALAIGAAAFAFLIIPAARLIVRAIH